MWNPSNGYSIPKSGNSINYWKHHRGSHATMPAFNGKQLTNIGTCGVVGALKTPIKPKAVCVLREALGIG